MNVDLEELAAIIEQLDRTEFTELHYEKGDLRLHVSRGGHLPAPDAPAPAPHPAAQPPAADPTAPPNAAVPAASRAAAGSTGGLDPMDLPEGYVAVRAPMLGTFYSTPKPGAAPFVEVGDAVEPDTALCIIEVMKLMNSVPAGVSGEVAAVFLKDGELAEFDQPLYAVKVAS